MFVTCKVIDAGNNIIEILEAPGVGNAFVTVDAIPAGLDDGSYFTATWPDLTVVDKQVVPIADGDITLAAVASISTVDGKITATTAV